MAVRPGGDTIAAVATALGTGGVGIIRISGSDAAAILAKVIGTKADALRDRYFEYGHVVHDGHRLDEVLFVLMRGPRSFTGEDVAEIHGHGGAANLAELLRCVTAAGARHADPGEFTRRAFENRRIDLTRAEAIADIVNASSAKALRVAQEQLAGSLGGIVNTLISDVVELTAEIEAGIDFPEDGLSEAERIKQVEQGNDAARQCAVLASSYGVGRVLRDGVDVVLRGAVNAGKSSLFNALVGKERSIVASDGGTTRDYVEAQVVWQGLSITLVDTAGIRTTSARESIEGQGIEMGAARAAQADLELFVIEGGEESEMAESDRILIVRSKCDLLAEADAGQGLSTSAKSGAGLEGLRDAILARVTGGALESAEGCVVTNERQRYRFEAANGYLDAASKLIERSAPAELTIVELNAARGALAEITGEEVGDEMLDALFSRFCIGK
ncbi:MAG: tRNA uridine-5-carboxymethylaminomethyl(34) synthesis GTPase MnmE [Myxococcales bacterium]|nr:tRNA uridine-5-carboxymethylaminomethyl(34) synthesis GTPase MnmE [Myxococcales bacterium]